MCLIRSLRLSSRVLADTSQWQSQLVDVLGAGWLLEPLHNRCSKCVRSSLPQPRIPYGKPKACPGGGVQKNRRKPFTFHALLRTEHERFGKRAGDCCERRRIEERIAKCARRLVCSQCGHKGWRVTPIPKLGPMAEKRERQNR